MLYGTLRTKYLEKYLKTWGKIYPTKNEDEKDNLNSLYDSKRLESHSWLALLT